MFVFFIVLCVLQTIMTVLWGVRGDIFGVLYSLAFVVLDVYYIYKHRPKKKRLAVL